VGGREPLAFRPAPRPGTPAEASALAVADLDADGDQDVLHATPFALRRLTNEGGNRNHSFALRLSGRISSRKGRGEGRDPGRQPASEDRDLGRRADGRPADVVFGLGPARPRRRAHHLGVGHRADRDRAHAGGRGRPPHRRLGVTELDRKPSSCPYLYTWNGERFEFVTDFLVPARWATSSPRRAQRPDRSSSCASPGEPRPREGRYELRVTNELEEVLYLDRVHLVAVDHPRTSSSSPTRA